MEIYERPLYLDRLVKWRDRDMIKVVTGIRRAGKSTILSIFRNKLATLGVSPDQMVSVNFEDPDVPEFTGWRAASVFAFVQLYRNVDLAMRQRGATDPTPTELAALTEGLKTIREPIEHEYKRAVAV